ncbi:MAG: molecular chaperone DnaJ [Rhodospirillaceae bacterium]|nr:molecular chaperone DnaJ [Rhodospirillaceae bacterium]
MKKREQILDVLSAPRIENGVRLCDAPECRGHGEFRAPKSRDDLNSYFWFCLEHVRAYNARWNFYAGLSQGEIEKQLRADTTWWRPTWPLGSRAGTNDPSNVDYGVFGADNWDQERIRTGQPEEAGWRPRPGSVEAEALAIFNLDAPVTKEDIKERYKALVKKNHPDTHRGDQKAEERLKIINRAYSALMACDDI